jgi:transposase
LILKTVTAETQVYTDEDSIYNRLEEWVFLYKTVNHSAGEYTCDKDGDGFCEVYSNTIEGFWSHLQYLDLDLIAAFHKLSYRYI